MKTYGCNDFQKTLDPNGKYTLDKFVFEYRVDEDGVWLQKDAYEYLSPTEREALWGIYANIGYNKPVLSFPCTETDLIIFLKNSQLSEMLKLGSPLTPNDDETINDYIKQMEQEKITLEEMAYSLRDKFPNLNNGKIVDYLKPGKYNTGQNEARRQEGKRLVAKGLKIVTQKTKAV